jgi:hypothetical protein
VCVDKSVAFHVLPTFILILFLSHQNLLFCVCYTCNACLRFEVKTVQNSRNFAAKECRVVMKWLVKRILG